MLEASGGVVNKQKIFCSHQCFQSAQWKNSEHVYLVIYILSYICNKYIYIYIYDMYMLSWKQCTLPLITTTVHHGSKCTSCHKAIVMITGMTLCFHNNIYMIYYAHLACVRFEHSMYRGSVMTTQESETWSKTRIRHSCFPVILRSFLLLNTKGRMLLGVKTKI